jgi:GT2 family glycosyltransferase
MKEPKVSIIVLNWNTLDYTLNCIKSLKKLNYKNFDIVVVDNGSKDNSVKVLRNVKGIKLIENKKNLGFAEGNNVGARYALEKGADYIFLLNNDTIVDKNLVKELVKVAESDPKIGIVGPKIYYINSKNLWFAGGKFNLFIGDARHIGANKIDKGQFNVIKKVDYTSGCAFLIKKRVIDEIGLIDPYYFIYYEETDWCARAKARGYKILYVPKAKLWHKVSASTKASSPFMIRLNIRNRLVFMKKNAKWYHWITFLLFYIKDFILLVAYKLLKRDFKAIKAAFKGLKEGLRYRKKSRI